MCIVPSTDGEKQSERKQLQVPHKKPALNACQDNSRKKDIVSGNVDEFVEKFTAVLTFHRKGKINLLTVMCS